MAGLSLGFRESGTPVCGMRGDRASLPQVLQVAAGAGLGGEGGTVVRKGADGRLQALPSTLSDMPAGPGKC